MTPVNPTMNGESLWPRLAELPLVIEACEYERLHAVLAHEFERITTHVRLTGAGADGLGEDVSIFREDGTSLHETRPELPLAGEWTLGGFCDQMATLTLFPEPPEYEGALRFRNWAFESAALDLALRQAGRPLHDGARPGAPAGALRQLARPRQGALDRAAAPAARPLPRRALQARRGGDLGAGARRRGRGHRRGRHDRLQGPLRLRGRGSGGAGALYDHVLAAFPDAYLEDPHDLPESRERLGDHLERVSYDSPIRSADDIGATPLAARVVNVKPSRIGSLRALFDVYARCAREGGRCTAAAWASWAWAAGRSSCSPRCSTRRAQRRGAERLQRGRPGGELPASPLQPRPEATGFRWGA
jgi:hypothetical protein